MKTMKKMGIMAFAAMALCLTACSGDDGGNSGGGGSSLDTYVNAKVDGVTFKTFSVQGHSLGAAMRTGTGDQTLISVSGSSASSMGSTDIKTIVISLLGITQPGTYTINSDSNSVLAYVDSASNISWDTSDCSGATGTIEITVLNDQKVEGSFSFTGKDDENCSSQKNITAGKFRGTFMTQ
jgi:hypothetical protein